MNSLEASIRNTKTKGELNTLRQKGEVPAIIYGGTEENQKVSLSKKQVKYLIDQEKLNLINQDFLSARMSETETLDVIKSVYEEYKIVDKCIEIKI